MIPPKPGPKYTHIQRGFCGEMGHSGNLTVKYIQSGITVHDLDYVTLVEKMPDSHTWNISELLQFWIDYNRVNKEIVPYLTDETKVKFFSPLTLVILPKSGTASIEQVPPFLQQQETVEEGAKYDVIEYPNVFSLKIYRDEPAFSSIHWNHEKCFLVAIDGQHRIAALRIAKKDPKALALIQDWKIPVVILVIYRKEDTRTDTLIEVTRKTFIYINEKAEKVNESRRIILNDESINSLATQEFIQTLHENDLKPIATRNQQLPPLFLIDWRGDREKTKKKPFLLNNIEIRDWFDHYLVGEDGSEDQKRVLQLNNLDPRIENGDRLTLDEARTMRSVLRADIIPSLIGLFERFKPFQQLIADWRKLEQKETSVISVQLFMELRYGTQDFGDLPAEEVKQRRETLIEELEKCKTKIDEATLKDIGLRSIIFSFGYLKEFFETSEKKFTAWKTFLEVFIDGLNKVYEDGWFKNWEDLKTEQKKLLTFVTYDEGGNVENYQLSDIKNGFGSFMAILIASKILADGSDAQKDLLAEIWQSVSEALPKALRKGYNRQHKAELADKALTEAKRRAEIKRKTEEAIKAHLEKIEKVVGITY